MPIPHVHHRFLYVASCDLFEGWFGFAVRLAGK
jgi:hypothetical protein